MRPHRAIAALIAASISVAAAVPAVPAAAAPCWPPPVVGRVVDPFRVPACRWCAGNRGLEYQVTARSIVRAVTAGTVTYSGVVAGTRYVVVDVGAGRRVTYGRLSSSAVVSGERVVTGSRLGTAEGTFFFGLRVHGVYTDPTAFIGSLRGRPRLVPLDGRPARPAPPPVLRCGRRIGSSGLPRASSRISAAGGLRRA